MGKHEETKSFRHLAAFGKRIEHYLIGLMLKEGLDVYIPMVDDDAIDAVIKCPDGRFVEVQIKARSKEVVFGDAALFSTIRHEYRPNYWFIFYSERMDTMWVLSSKEFLRDADHAKGGKHVGTHSVWFNGRNTKAQTEHTKPQWIKYIEKDFSRIINENPDKT